MAASTEEEPAKEEERQESFLASFNRADAKLFIVTFAGTVAANILTVMVVALAVILARSNGRPTPGAVLMYLACVVPGILTVGVGLTAFRQKRPRDSTSQMVAAVLLVVTAAMGLMTLVFLLVLLGYAVGVK